MKRLAKILFTTSFLFSLNILHAQSVLPSFSGFPLKQGDSPLFGKDIIIHDQPDRDQRNIAICSAFNGWLYCVYSYLEGSFLDLSVLRSIDNGITWDVILEGTTGVVSSVATRVDIVARGNSISDLKLFFGFAYFRAYPEIEGAIVYRYHAEPFLYEDEFLGGINNVKHFAIASDYIYPASNSDPFSMAILYSKKGTKDSIIFLSSSNGGISFDNRRVLATSSNFLHRVALNYGRSPSWSSGRYFAAWEEQDSLNSNLGHIYTSHSETNFNSPFTKPICLDSLDSSEINKARNPIIACQFNDANNDSANLTEIVLFEKYLPSTNSYDLAGYYNLQATNSNYFRNFSVSVSPNNKLQSDINFNPYNSTFMMTYFDSTDHKLPFLSHDFNMTNPNSWNINNPGYNDSANIISPHPSVTINTTQQGGMNVWIAERTNGNGVALFDAPYSTWTGVSEIPKTNIARLFGAYPNPCNNEVMIAFELKKTGKVTINVLSALGQNLGTVTNQSYSEGKHMVRYDVSKFETGTYLYEFNSGNGITTNGKFSIIR